MNKKIAQNQLNKSCAMEAVKILSAEEKLKKIKLFEEKGYEHNDGLHTLLKMETIIPYNFVLYCIMKESLM